MAAEDDISLESALQKIQESQVLESRIPESRVPDIGPPPRRLTPEMQQYARYYCRARLWPLWILTGIVAPLLLFLRFRTIEMEAFQSQAKIMLMIAIGLGAVMGLLLIYQVTKRFFMYPAICFVLEKGEVVETAVGEKVLRHQKHPKFMIPVSGLQSNIGAVQGATSWLALGLILAGVGIWISYSGLISIHVGVTTWMMSLGLIGALMCLLGFRKKYVEKENARSRTATTTGKIVRAELEKRPSSSPGWVYRTIVFYQYEVNGRKMTNSTYPGLTHKDYNSEMRVANQFMANQEVTVHYDPANPDSAHFGESGDPLIIYVGYLISCAICGLGIGGLVFTISH